MREKQHPTIHKSNSGSGPVKVSIILLDWSCRERFHALDWLNRQNVSREQYELIWIELHDRLVPEALEKSDVVITCNQKGVYHKHLGYNIGLLHAKGKIVTVCDSDAVFPEDFINSIINSFNLPESDTPESLVLMHYQWRSPALYPDGISKFEELRNYTWADLWPNVGACMSVSKSDAICFGGFDEHKSFRGYLCGPYDLGWRLVNAGVPERWHDERVALWHFSHPDPPATYGQAFSLKMWREKTYPHIKHHALTAVEAFSTGRILPQKENSDIYKIRMQQRRIGTPFEEEYAWITGRSGFTRWQKLKLHIGFATELPVQLLKSVIGEPMVHALKRFLGVHRYEKMRSWKHSLNQKKID